MTQYDADDTGKMSYTELTAMLDSLGSTLTKKTLESYFSRCGKSVDKDEMTFDEVVKCFEAEVIKDHSQKEKAVNEKPDELGSASGIATPANGERGESYTVAAQPANAGLDVTGPQGNISSPVDAHELAEQIKNSRPRELQEEDDNTNRPGNQRIASVSSTNIPAVKVRSATIADEAAGDIPQIGGASGVASPSDLSEEDGDISSSPPDDRERIINIRSCPLCHRRRLGKRSEQDIVTHLAICASADWSRVDRIVTANYVTSSQAQRKFFTKLVNKVAIGAYSLGANSANILVQDRLTGQLQEEKMAVSLVVQRHFDTWLTSLGLRPTRYPCAIQGCKVTHGGCQR
jgi:phosphatidylserine decarboxylase